MSRANRKIKSFSLDPSVISYVRGTKGPGSESERVNRMLKRTIREEQYEELERQAAEFFAQETAEERKERKAWRKAATRVLQKN